MGPDGSEHQPQRHHPQGQQRVTVKADQPRQHPQGIQTAARRGQQQGVNTVCRRQHQTGQDRQGEPQKQSSLAKQHYQRPVEIERESHQHDLHRAVHTRSAVSCTTLMVRALKPASQ
ncbi:hypothetical protein D3C75_980210 [compost metagenome]